MRLLEAGRAEGRQLRGEAMWSCGNFIADGAEIRVGSGIEAIWGGLGRWIRVVLSIRQGFLKP